MKKLCAIIFPAFLCIALSSCAWLYQVTGVEEATLTEKTTSQPVPVPRSPKETTENGDSVTVDDTVVHEGCYSNGTYIMELTRIDNTLSGGYQIIIYTPQYGIRMFAGSVADLKDCTTSFTVLDNDDSRVSLTVDPSEDGRTLYAKFFVNEEENALISGNYTYYDQRYWETEESVPDAVISAGEYTYQGYKMTILYESDRICVTIRSSYGDILLQETKITEEPLHYVLFEGEWGSTILVSVRDGSGRVVVSGRGEENRTLQYAGTYTLS